MSQKLIYRLLAILLIASLVVSGCAPKPTITLKGGGIEVQLFKPVGCADPCLSVHIVTDVSKAAKGLTNVTVQTDFGDGVVVNGQEAIHDYTPTGAGKKLLTVTINASDGLALVSHRVQYVMDIPLTPIVATPAPTQIPPQ